MIKMGLIYILEKKGKYCHTVSTKKKQKLEDDGWKQIVSLTGWNMSITIYNR